MNDTIKTIHDLHTTHGSFMDREIPAEDLDTILKASVRAASASNMQSYSIVVVTDRDMMKELCGYQASVLLLYCIDTNRMASLAKHLGYNFAMDPSWQLTTGAVDVVLAAQTAAIAARSLEISSLFTNGIHRGDPERVFTLLNLPEKNCLPIVALLLGYEENAPEKPKERLSGTGIIHKEKYQQCSDEELDEIIGECNTWDENYFESFLASRVSKTFNPENPLFLRMAVSIGLVFR